MYIYIYIYMDTGVTGRDGFAHDEDDDGKRKSMVCLLLDREENQAHVR